MKINIASSHRFHLLDLARELQKQGHDVRFYSYVPTKRCVSFGLAKECTHCLLWLVAPIMLLQKVFPKFDTLQRIRNLLMDYYLSLFMSPCDIYIALGTVYKQSFISAKKRFSAITIIEWGSKHIDEQQRILAAINAPLNKEYYNRRSRDGYIIADYIAIASSHVKQSFIERGIPSYKLLQNPYGVDLEMFHPTRLTEIRYDIIMAGGWGLRKGCDLLIEVCKKYNHTLLHVGSIVDLEFPQLKNMTHIASVNQKELLKYYAQAKIFVLPSREEGLALVQAQALICGLPIICSKHTGGIDLRNFLDDKEWIIEMQEYTTVELHRCIQKALTLSDKQVGERNYAHKNLEKLSWEAYGKRYNENLKRILV